MAKPAAPRVRARRGLVGLGAIVLVLVLLNLLGVLLAPGSSFATKIVSLVPKLGLDLQGGTEVILQPVPQGGKNPTSDQLTQSVAIIRQRVNAAGIGEAQIAPLGNNVVVSIPGPLSNETRTNIESSARMDFRPVLVAGEAPTASAGTKGSAAYTPPASLATTPSVKPTDGSDLAQVTPYLQALYTNYNCKQDVGAAAEPASKPLVTCNTDGTAKYLLGPVEVQGSHIKTATSGVSTTSQGVSTGEYVVNLAFDPTGTTEFGKVTSRLVSLQSPQNQFAILLDGKVVSAPQTNSAIENGQAEISGSFTADSSKALANQLQFGSLPISFRVQSINTISATLGSAQLLSGLIAGLIGLLLVVGYSLFQYRLLGLVTIGSLLMSSVLTYLVIDFLSWREGYRLSLAGVAGLIVSIGITADSFIVYFERIRDELREGRALSSAVENGWRRAIRTVLASDSVNFLAASTLFVLSVSDVRGFALTLGITTLIDVVVVGLFTHPVLQLLTRVPFFAGGHRLSGLDPAALGAVYRGRGQFRPPVLTGGAIARSRGEAQRRQTIAERKAAEGQAPAAAARDSIERSGN